MIMESKLNPKKEHRDIIEVCKELENDNNRKSDIITLSSSHGFENKIIMTSIIENKLDNNTIKYGLDELYTIEDDIKLSPSLYKDIGDVCKIILIENKNKTNDVSYFDIHKTFNKSLLLKSNLIISDGISIIDWCKYIDTHKKNIKYLIIINKTHLKKFINSFSVEYVNSYDIIFVENKIYTGEEIKLSSREYEEYDNDNINNKSIVSVIGMLTRDHLWDRIIINHYDVCLLGNTFPYFNSILKWVIKVPIIKQNYNYVSFVRLYDNLIDNNNNNILTYNKYTYNDLSYNIQCMTHYDIQVHSNIDDVPGYNIYYKKEDKKEDKRDDGVLDVLLYEQKYIELSTLLGIYVKDHKQFINKIYNNNYVNIDDDMKLELNNKIKLLKWINNINDNYHNLKPSLTELTIEELYKMPDELCKYNGLTAQLGDIYNTCLEYIKPINKSIYRLLNRIDEFKEDAVCSICYEDYKENDDICIMNCCNIHICVICFYKLCDIENKRITCAFCKNNSNIANNIHANTNILMNFVQCLYDYKCIKSKMYVNRKDPFWNIYDIIYNNNIGVLYKNVHIYNILHKTRVQNSTPSNKNRKYIIFFNNDSERKKMKIILNDRGIKYVEHKNKNSALYNTLTKFDNSDEKILLTLLTKKIYFHFNNVTDLIYNIKSYNNIDELIDYNSLYISSHIGHTISPKTKYNVRVIFNFT